MQKQEITAVAFIYNNGKAFIAKRSNTKKFMPGIYELPGGHIEFGEKIEDGLVREIKEEFDADIIVGDLFYAFTYVSGEIHSVEMVYFATLIDFESIILKPEEHSEYRRISQNEIEEYLVGNDAEKNAILKGFLNMNNNIR